MSDVLENDDVLYILESINCDVKAILKICGEMESSPDPYLLHAVEVLANDINIHRRKLTETFEESVRYE